MDDFNHTSSSNELPKTVFDGLLTHDGLDLFIIIVIVSLGCPLTLFGIFANIVNLTVFYKQGFNDTVNISLFALALSDACSLVTLLWVNICLMPWLNPKEIRMKPRDVMFLTGGQPHVCFARITCWITVFITAERCICITLPFKVKGIFTTKVVVVSLVVIATVMIIGVVPVYLSFELIWIVYPETNVTILSQRLTENQLAVLSTTYIQVFFQFASFTTITVLTVTLVTKLRQNTKWRASATSGNENTETISTRDRKVVRMVILITCILLACISPGIILQLTWIIEPQFATGGKYHNAQMACWLFLFFLDAVNASANIFVYYNMSSRYREVFDQMFLCRQQEKTDKNK